MCASLRIQIASLKSDHYFLITKCSGIYKTFLLIQSAPYCTRIVGIVSSRCLRRLRCDRVYLSTSNSNDFSSGLVYDVTSGELCSPQLAAIERRNSLFITRDTKRTSSGNVRPLFLLDTINSAVMLFKTAAWPD